MPALPSLFKGRKKAAQAGPSKSAFSYLRGESSASVASPSSTSPRSLAPVDTTEVIDIKEKSDKGLSLDFDGGKPDETDDDLIDTESRAPSTIPEIVSSPLVQLDVDISSPEGLTDWFESKFRSSRAPSVRLAGSSSERVTNGLPDKPKQASAVVRTRGEGEDASQSTSSTDDVLANLQAMDSSHFGQLPGFNDFKRQDHSNHPYKSSPPKPIFVPKSRNTQSSGLPSTTKSARSPLETPASSAVSGTTIARALLSNTFVLTNESRLSKYRNGLAGLTRTDSMTLPRVEHSFGGSYDDSFITSPDAPPIPSGADALYQPPKKSRTGDDQRDQVLKRRSSTGSIHPKALPPTPSAGSRTSSALLSPGTEFDLSTFIPNTPEPGVDSPLPAGAPGVSRVPRSPRSPLPPTPKLAYTLSEEDHSDRRDSAPEQYTVMDAQSPSVYSTATSPDYNTLSPPLSTEEPQSAKNLEDVLNYYAIPKSPNLQVADTPYRPAFSPISEESSSQLSPPAPYKSDKRESKRSIPVPIGARSPSTGSLRKPGRSDSMVITGPRVISRQSSNVSERPHSITQVPSPISATSTASFGSAGSDLLAPPPLSSIFNRARSGSAPSPIRVVRDSKDGTTYKITVGSRADSDTPTSPDDGDTEVTQEFPETPALFSPLLTGDGNTGNVSTSMSSVVENIEVPAMPTTPLSATIPRTQSPPNVAQHMLQRAGTTINHNRQNSLTKARVVGGRVRPTSPSNLRRQDTSVESSPKSNRSRLSTIPDSPSAMKPASELPQSTEIAEERLPESTNASIGAEISRVPSRGASILTQGSDSSSMYTPSASESSRSRQKSLPPAPLSPLPHRSSTASSLSVPSRPSSMQIPEPDHIPSRLPSPIPEMETPPAIEPSTPPRLATPPPVSDTTPTPLEPPISSPVVLSPPEFVASLPPAPAAFLASLPMLRPISTLHIPLPPSHPPPSPPSPTTQLSSRFARTKTTPLALTITHNSSRTENTVAVNGPESGATEPSPEQPAMLGPDNTSHESITLPNTLRPRENLTVTPEGYTGRASDIFRGTSLGSPPPYYVAISDGNTPHAVPPAVFPGNADFTFPSHPSHQSQNSQSEAGPSNLTNIVPRTPNIGRESSLSMRGRMRPPLPTGPRRPSQMLLGSISTSHLRDRSGSISSVGSNPQYGARARQSSPAASPNFQTPAPRWRGLTMEAAKWTFTSAQLQAIVSRAIRQSAEASSIRLLRLEVLDEELPQELQKLETSRSELKARFKIFSKRRNGLVSGLSMYVSGEEDGSLYGPRMIEELKEVNANLDKLTEDLHSLDNQIAQLELLVQIHSGSALAMALRKLNASFLKQVSENQTLRDRIQALEAERDEAWHQAENIATEIDSIHGRFESAPPSRRSSRISAVKKSSIRVSRAGLRSSGSRISQLSSAASGGQIYGLTPRSPMPRMDTIPPVPPVPKPRPTTISTDIPMTSPPPLSPEHFETPTSETRALLAAQEELYAMLGITNPDRALRRSLSFSMASGTSPSAGAIHTSHYPSLRSPGSPPAFRRASLPGNTMMSEAYQAMAADRNAVLATIDMLSSTD